VFDTSPSPTCALAAAPSHFEKEKKKKTEVGFVCEATGRKQAEAVVGTGRVLFFFADSFKISCNHNFCGLNIDLILPVRVC